MYRVRCYNGDTGEWLVTFRVATGREAEMVSRSLMLEARPDWVCVYYHE